MGDIVPLVSLADEYRSGEDDDADNEVTIEEEEALAAAEGRDVKVRRWRGRKGRGVIEVLAWDEQSCSTATALHACATLECRTRYARTLAYSYCSYTPHHILHTHCPQREEADELAGLDEEADLPLEELLARYGNYHLAMAAEGVAEEGGTDEEMPGGMSSGGREVGIAGHAGRQIAAPRHEVGVVARFPMPAHCSCAHIRCCC